MNFNKPLVMTYTARTLGALFQGSSFGLLFMAFMALAIVLQAPKIFGIALIGGGMLLTIKVYGLLAAGIGAIVSFFISPLRKKKVVARIESDKPVVKTPVKKARKGPHGGSEAPQA